MNEESGELITITMSPIELTYLASMLGYDWLLGIQDPFVGWLTEEIEEAWQGAKQSLVEKGLIQERPNGGVIMDVVMAGIMVGCTQPDATFFISKRSRGDDGAVNVFHLGRYVSVRQNLPTNAKDDIELSLFEGYSSAIEEMLSAVKLSGCGDKGFSKPITVTLEVLFQAMEAQGETATDVLIRNHVDKEAAAVLGATLESSCVYSSLVGLKIEDGKWHAKGLGVISNGGSLWRVKPDMESDEVQAIVEVCGEEQARKDARTLVESLLLG